MWGGGWGGGGGCTPPPSDFMIHDIMIHDIINNFLRHLIIMPSFMSQEQVGISVKGRGGGGYFVLNRNKFSEDG